MATTGRSRSPAATGPRASCSTSWPTGPSRTSGTSRRHGGTFTRLVLDATGEFCGPERAEALDGRVPRRAGPGRRAAAPGARRAVALRLGRAAPAVLARWRTGRAPRRPASRGSSRRSRVGHVLVVRAGDADAPRRDDHVWSVEPGRVAVEEGSRRAVIAALAANVGIAVAEVRRLRRHRRDGAARRGDPLGRRLGERGHPRRRGPARPSGPRPRSTRSGSGGSATSSRSSSRSSSSPRVAVRDLRGRRQAGPPRAGRPARRRLRRARRRARAREPLAAHRVPGGERRRAATELVGVHPHTKAPELPVVLLEDFGGIVGLMLAARRLGLTVVTGDARYDAAAECRDRVAARRHRHAARDRDQEPPHRRGRVGRATSRTSGPRSSTGPRLTGSSISAPSTSAPRSCSSRRRST